MSRIFRELRLGLRTFILQEEVEVQVYPVSKGSRVLVSRNLATSQEMSDKYHCDLCDRLTIYAFPPGSLREARTLH